MVTLKLQFRNRVETDFKIETKMDFTINFNNFQNLFHSNMPTSTTPILKQRKDY